jgi:hypothetical protein
MVDMMLTMMLWTKNLHIGSSYSRIHHKSYVADINEPFARKLEGILASFGRQTRLEEAQLFEPTHITRK